MCPVGWHAWTVSLLDVLAFGATASAGAAGYGFAESRAFTTRSVDANVLPSGSAPIRVLHLSDLHITPAQTRKIQWVNSLVAHEPDLVVVTGDFLAHKFAVPAVMEALGELTQRPGLFVLGSNDYFAPELKNPLMYFKKSRTIKSFGRALPTQDLVDELTRAGWSDLNNAQTSLHVGELHIHARGTDDPHINKDDYDKVAGKFADGAFALGVTHAPYTRVLNSFARDNADIVLAGHTHGGQVCIPFYGALVTNCDLPTKQAKGLSTFTTSERSMPIHVSAGVGTSPYTQIRIACRPEATLLTLHAKND